MPPDLLFINARRVLNPTHLLDRGLVSRLPFHLGLSFVTMPGHDHTLRAMFHLDFLSNSTMVLNWICPVTDGNRTFLAHSTGEYSHSFPHSMDLLWVGILFSLAHPVACLTNFPFTPHSRAGLQSISLYLQVVSLPF